jgi:MFS family permease
LTLSHETTDQTRTASRFARVVPLAFMTYSLAFLDRNNYGYAAGGMTAKLHLSPNNVGLLAAMFFVGYSLFQIPSTGYAAKRSVRWVVFWALILWGVLSSLTGVIENVGLLYVDRLALGAVEGVVLPAMLVYLTRWFTKPERSRANSLLMVGNPLTMMYASALSGFLIQYFDKHLIGSRQGWQMMFILEGLPSILWAFVWLAIAKDHPSQARWLTSDEADAIQAKLDREQAEVAHVRDYWAAFSDIRVVLLSVMFFFFSAPAYAFMFWMPTIMKSATGRGMGAVGLMLVIPYGIAALALVVVSWISDKTLHRKIFVWGSHLVGATAWLVVAIAGTEHFAIGFIALAVVCCCMYTPTSPQWAWMAEMFPRNVIGESMALVNSAGALGGLIGTYMVGFLLIHFQTNKAAFIFQAGCFTVAAILAASVRSTVKKAKRLQGVQDASPALQGTIG